MKNKIINFNFLILLFLFFTCSYTAKAEITYYHTDLLGSPIATSDEQGNLKWEEQYKPYGERIVNSPASADNEMWYTGKQHDQDTGLTYMNARYYDPVVGRFMAIDPASFNEGVPGSFNRYSYANNNPYLYNDPEGEIINNVIGGLWAGAQNAAIQGLEMSLGLRQSFSFTELATDTALGAVTSGFSNLKNAGRLAGLVNKYRKSKFCCFVAGTKVLTISGYKNIEDVKLGELVAAKNVETGELSWKSVEKIFIELRDIIKLAIVSPNGEITSIGTTDDHPFYVIGKGWINTENLLPGDLIETYDEGYVTVYGINKTKRTEKTYNFIIADFHTYYVTENNILVHNCNKISNEIKDIAKGSNVFHAFGKARNLARTKSGIGDDAIPFVQKIGPKKGNVSGMQSPDGSKGWRIDFDPDNPDKGFHINWWNKKGKKRKDWVLGTIVIDKGSYKDYLEIIDHFPKR